MFTVQKTSSLVVIAVLICIDNVMVQQTVVMAETKRTATYHQHVNRVNSHVQMALVLTKAKYVMGVMTVEMLVMKKGVVS